MSWPAPARADSPRRARRGWRIAGYATVLALVVVVAVVWLSVLRDVKAPLSSARDVAKPSGKPSAAECAELMSALIRPTTPEPRVSPEVRARFRECLAR